MDKTTYFDFCAFVIMLIIIASVFFRRMTHGRVNKFFIATVFATFIAVIFDIWAITLDNMSGKFLAQKYFVNSMYLFIHSLTVLLYIAYLISLTDTWHKLRNNLAAKLLLPLPLTVTAIMLIVNIFNHKIFYINADDVYARGDWFFILYASALVYVVYGVYYIFHYKKLFKASRFWALASIFMFESVAVVFQMFFPYFPVEMFATTVGLLFITILIQRPEENIDIITGINKLTAYTNDIKRGFANDKPVNIILINISNFSSIRDIIGFDAANDLLRKLAINFSELNKKAKLRADLYYLDKGRFRFVIDSSNTHMTEDIATQINETLKQGIHLKHMDINLISYVCIARCPEDIDNYETLMFFGEHFSTENQYTGNVIFAKDLFTKEQIDLYTKLDSIIENAITNKKFQVYYQPIFSIKESRFNSAEALLRLIDDEYGFIPPNVFIPAAERSGAIHKIGTYVLEEVCQFIANADFDKLNIDYIEINLSVVQCMHSNLPNQVLSILKKYNVSPDKINLEITETAASYSQNIMAENIEQLNASGISFSLDDYGTGYSNIQRVSSLPLKIVKLDRTFVNAEDNPKLTIVLENTVKMLKDMEMQIVVEGVETEQLVKRFTDMECEYIQGYYYSKPIPKKEFIEFILSRNKTK